MKNFKKLLGSVREFKAAAIVTVIFIILEVFIEVVIPFITADMVNAIKTIADEEGVEGLRFYVSEPVNDSPYDFTYRDLGRNIEPIFATFNKALDSIESYRGRD